MNTVASCTLTPRWLAAAGTATLIAFGWAATPVNAAILDSVNEAFSPGVLFWAAPSGKIGWYWTPAFDVELAGIQTQLNMAGSNINNNFTMTVTVFTDRPAVGGTEVGSFQFDASTVVDAPWRGGSFATPLTLNGGTSYFVGFAGWEQVLTGSGGGGVNFVDVPDPANPPAGLEDLAFGYTGVDWEILMNTSQFPVVNVDAPIVRFLGERIVAQVPGPASAVLMLVGLAGLASILRGRGR